MPFLHYFLSLFWMNAGLTPAVSGGQSAERFGRPVQAVGLHALDRLVGRSRYAEKEPRRPINLKM